MLDAVLQRCSVPGAVGTDVDDEGGKAAVHRKYSKCTF